MKKMRDFDTLVEALNALKSEGYTYDFNLVDNCLECDGLEEKFDHQKFEVDEVFRFEGISNPDDNSILYAISTTSGVKGILLDAYGAYSGEISQDMLEKLKIKG